jgi:sec-independent protein translocase protein TatA
MLGSLGAGEVLVIGLIAVVLFGGSRIASLGKGLGDGIRNFKKGLKEADAED